MRRRSSHVWEISDTTKDHIAECANAQAHHTVAVFHIVNFHRKQLELGLRALVTSQDPALTALLFQIRLLGLTGFRPRTDHCAACGKGRLMGELQFSPLSGGLVCAVCAARQAFRCLPLSRGSLAFLHQALRLSPAVVDRLKAA